MKTKEKDKTNAKAKANAKAPSKPQSKSAGGGFLRALWLPLLLALVVRLIFLIPALMHPDRLNRPDTDGYRSCALHLADTGNYGEATRAPGFPLLIAAVTKCGGEARSVAVILTLISIVTLLPVSKTAELIGGSRAAWLAGLFWALHPTLVGNSFLLLSDTLFGLFAALQLFLFVQYRETQKAGYFLGSVAVAALGALVRPINLPWLFVALVLLLFTGETWKRKGLLALGATALFLLIVTPWMIRNARNGEGFCIDTNTGAMVHQNGAMLISKVRGTSYEAEKQRIRSELDELFTDAKRFPDRASCEAHRKALYFKEICAHPLTWFGQHFDWKILLPDAPALTEAVGATAAGRGTLEVLQRDGVFAAVRHYFGENWIVPLLILSPLIAVAAIVLAGLLCRIVADFCLIKARWYELLMLLGFAEYYLFLPGAITVPRYQIPALPLIISCAAAFFLGERGKKAKH